MSDFKDVQEWKCQTISKRCKGQDPCYFNSDERRCPIYKFKIKTKEVLLP
jgi:hypothetical protein